MKDDDLFIAKAKRLASARRREKYAKFRKAIKDSTREAAERSFRAKLHAQSRMGRKRKLCLSAS